MTCGSDLKSKLQFPQMKFLLEHNHSRLLLYDLWLRSHFDSRAGLWWRMYGLQSPKYLLLGPLQEKCANPWPRAWGDRQRAWWAGQKAKGARFHSTSTTSSHLNLMAAPQDRWDGRKPRHREVMPFPQGLIAGYWKSNSHLSLSFWQSVPDITLFLSWVTSPFIHAPSIFLALATWQRPRHERDIPHGTDLGAGRQVINHLLYWVLWRKGSGHRETGPQSDLTLSKVSGNSCPGKWY